VVGWQLIHSNPSKYGVYPGQSLIVLEAVLFPL